MSVALISDHLASPGIALTAGVSPNVSLYKTPGTKNTQAQRRHELLHAIKERRQASIDEKRHINEVFKCDGIEENDPNAEPMDTTVAKNKKRKKMVYANKLMLSEWLLEKPLDFEEKWLMKVCRKGVRNLVVAVKGKTKCFSKTGYFIQQFQSQLPGGSSSTPMRFTILDCIFQQEENAFYVLDVLVWNSYSVMNSTTEFRFFFLQSKLEDSIDLQYICKGNEHKFLYTPHKSTDLCSIAEAFVEHHHNVDGVLFYHSEVSYLPQITPLVGWLKVFMLPEMLGVPVHSDYLLEIPVSYTNCLEYIQNFDKLMQKRNRKKNKRLKDVDMTEVEDFDENHDSVDGEVSAMEN